MAFTQISGSGLKNNSITNAHLHSGADIAASKLANSGVTAGSYGSASLIPAITVNAQGLVTSVSTNSFTTTDNNFTNALLTKLNGIEASATADQTNAEIKTAYEANSDTNAFTDALLTKLNGIAANANNYSFPYTISASASNSTVVLRHSSGYIFANYFNTTPNDVTSGVTKVCVETSNDGYIRHGTPAAIRSFINVADGATNVTNYVTNDASDTLSGGTYTFSSSTAQKIILSGATNPYIRFQEGTTNKAYLQWHGGDGYVLLVNEESGEYLRIGSGNNGLQFVVDGTARNVMHSGNVSTYALPIGGGTVTGAVTVNGGDLRVDGGRNLRIGDGSDDERILIQKIDNNQSDHIIFYNGTTRVGEIGCEDTSWLRINQETAKNIYTPRLIRADGGFQVNGSTVVDSNKNLTVPANADLNLATGSWTGNHTKIQHHSNTLYIVGGTNGIILREAGTNRWHMDGSGHFVPGGSGNYDIGNSSNYVNNIYVNDIHANGGAGAVTIKDGSDIRFESGTWTGETTCKLQHHNNYLYLQAPAFVFRDDGGSNRWFITSSGHFIPGASNTYDLGDTSTMVRDIYCSTVYLGQSTRYLSNVTGQYGSVQINGSGVNGYEGFSIDGRYVLMHNGGSDGGLYNDVNNEWYLYTQANGTTIMYFDGSQRIRTESYGARMNGTFRPNTTNSSDLGASDARWATFYVVNQPNVSDRNEKNTIQSSDLGLSFINKLNAVSFKWNDTSLGTKTRYGLIVQEVEEAVKELGKDPDDMGMIDKPEKGAMGLCVSELVAPLVKAIQELSAKVAALEAA